MPPSLIDRLPLHLPKLFKAQQRFPEQCVNDIPATVDAQLRQLDLSNRVAPGDRIAITAGSRGIANIAEITKGIVDHVRQLGAEPFIVPAMGSHGGATAKGQTNVLATLGITEETCGCPILSSMDTVVVCKSAEGVDVHFDRHAFEADHVIVCNRVKLHTIFHGPIQSGLMKMLLIGLGKHVGASTYHRAFRDYSFDQIVRSVSSTVIEKCGILAGLAIVENGYEQTTRIQSVHPGDFVAAEPGLLQLSRESMARLPFDRLDVLIVDEIGKDISGAGMDTNVIGRKVNPDAALDDEWPKIKRIVVRGLTEKTHGNATGIGSADITTQRVIDAIDYHATSVNCLTSGRTAMAAIPLHVPTEREAIQAAVRMVGLTPPEQARLVRIRNTLELDRLVCSEVLLEEVSRNPQMEILSDLHPMAFDEQGDLIDF